MSESAYGVEPAPSQKPPETVTVEKAGPFAGLPPLRGARKTIEREMQGGEAGLSPKEIAGIEAAFANIAPPYRVTDPEAAATHDDLARVLNLAFEQSAAGKGQERHGHGKPFTEQPILAIGRMMGVGGHAYQIAKKAQEAVTMAGRGKHAAAKAEMLGAIVYAAAAYLLIEEQESGR